MKEKKPKDPCNEFYLRDTRSNTGNSCTFWVKGGCGYSTDLNRAEIFSKEDAQRRADHQDHFVPLSKARVDELATIRVDMQRLRLASTDFSEGVIIQRLAGKYDGNDIFFDDGEGGHTANYSKAKVYTDLGVLKGLSNQPGIVLSKSFLDSVCRPTIQVQNINHRTMITAAGLRYRSPRKKRETTGKTRGNCPDCGQLTWGYDPHTNEPCDKHRYGIW